MKIIHISENIDIIDTKIKTSMDTLTPAEMIDYIEVENSLYYMERMKIRENQGAERRRKKNKSSRKLFMKLAWICGL